MKLFTIFRNIANGIKTSFTRLTSLETWQSDTADYIVEKGYADNWYYRKWSSGTAECWQRVSLGSIAITAGYANGWKYYGSSAWYYPTNLFTESPMVTGSVRRATGLFFISFNLNEKDRMRFYLASCQQESAQPTEVNFYAIGKWK